MAVFGFMDGVGEQACKWTVQRTRRTAARLSYQLENDFFRKSLSCQKTVAKLFVRFGGPGGRPPASLSARGGVNSIRYVYPPALSPLLRHYLWRHSGGREDLFSCPADTTCGRAASACS
jgi:hypothetical protein